MVSISLLALTLITACLQGYLNELKLSIFFDDPLNFYLKRLETNNDIAISLHETCV